MICAFTALLMSSVLTLTSGRFVNYCGAKMCSYTNAHTFCQFPPGPGPQCSGYRDAQLSSEEKSRLLARLNKRRSDAANGLLRSLPAAGNMLKLRWVEELAREAQRWADQCRPPQLPEDNDVCRDLFSVTVGQCIATVVGDAPGLRVESMVDFWYMQSILYKGNVTFYEPPVGNASNYADFAQLLWARTYMVGCGRSRFIVPWQDRWRSIERLVCNFAPRGPGYGWPLWIPALPATTCSPRSLPDSEFPGLCHFQSYLDETLDVQNEMSMEEHVLLNTILDIENNDQLDYMSSLDEIYLTKIAIATIDGSTTKTYHSNPMKKRDVDKTSGNEIRHLNIIETPSQEVSNKITGLQPGVANQALQKILKKVKIVGRPKSYKIDDLSDDGGVQTTENTNEIFDEMPKTKKEFEAEYEYVENQDSNVSTTVNSTVSGIVYTTAVEKFFVISTTTVIPTESTVTSDVPKVEEVSGSVKEIPTEPSTPIAETLHEIVKESNYSLPLENEDDYMADPETSQDLDNTLIRMERQSGITTVAKMRRAIIELETTVSPKIDNDKIDSDNPAAGNNTLGLNKAPMLNMVLRYMPYLKPYENEILGRVVSRGSVTCARIFCDFFIVFYVILMFLDMFCELEIGDFIK